MTPSRQRSGSGKVTSSRSTFPLGRVTVSPRASSSTPSAASNSCSSSPASRNVAVPIPITSSSVTATEVIRLPLTKVPLWLPTSVSWKRPSPRARSSAWRLDTRRSAMTTSLPLARPISIGQAEHPGDPGRHPVRRGADAPHRSGRIAGRQASRRPTRARNRRPSTTAAALPAGRRAGTGRCRPPSCGAPAARRRTCRWCCPGPGSATARRLPAVPRAARRPRARRPPRPQPDPCRSGTAARAPT